MKPTLLSSVTHKTFGPSMTRKTFGAMKVAEQSIRNRCVFVGLILTSAVLFTVVMIFNTLAGNPNLINGGPFQHSIGNVSAMFPVRITPAGWAFSIWVVIYLLQLFSTLYSLSLLLRRSSSIATSARDGDQGPVNEQPAYKHPAILSPLYFLLINLSCCINVAWLFLWDGLLLSASLVFLGLNAVLLWCALSLVATRLLFYNTVLLDMGKKWDSHFIKVVVINWLAMYATWSSFATTINLAIAATYQWQLPLSEEEVAVSSLGVIFFLLVLYWVLDVTVFNRFTRCVWSPYGTSAWALAAILDNNWDGSCWSSFICAACLATVAGMAIVKVALDLYRLGKVNNPYRRLTIGQTVRLEQS